jgi:hypothetical protein
MGSAKEIVPDRTPSATAYDGAELVIRAFSLRAFGQRPRRPVRDIVLTGTGMLPSRKVKSQHAIVTFPLYRFARHTDSAIE